MACCMVSGNQKPIQWPESRTTMLCRSLDVSRLYGKGDEYILRSPVPDFESRQPPAGTPRFNAYFYVRTSQDCGSSTAQGPQKSRLLCVARFCCMLRRFVDNNR